MESILWTIDSKCWICLPKTFKKYIRISYFLVCFLSFIHSSFFSVKLFNIINILFSRKTHWIARYFAGIKCITLKRRRAITDEVIRSQTNRFNKLKLFKRWTMGSGCVCDIFQFDSIERSNSLCILYVNLGWFWWTFQFTVNVNETACVALLYCRKLKLHIRTAFISMRALLQSNINNVNRIPIIRRNGHTLHIIRLLTHKSTSFYQFWILHYLHFHQRDYRINNILCVPNKYSDISSRQHSLRLRLQVFFFFFFYFSIWSIFEQSFIILIQKNAAHAKQNNRAHT